MDSVRGCIAGNIKRYRLASGMSVEEFGEAVGKSGKTISAWEVGRGQPDADMLISLCRLFDVDISDFYGEDGAVSLTSDEKALLGYFQQLNISARATLLMVARSLAQTERD